MKLDVGCGNHPKGDVNIDLFIGQTPHGRFFINPKRIRNFIKAHVEYLPLRNDAFTECSCFHVLEHKGVNFWRAFNELMRVTNGMVEIEIPHRFGDRGKMKMHDKYFNITSIEGELARKGISFQNDVIYGYFPHEFVPLLRLPKLLRLKIPSCKI